jgi:hypothetical protein
VSHPLRWDPDLTKAEKGQSILRDPLRAGLAAAGIALAIGSLRPWAEGTAGSQPQQFGGFDGAGDGAILLFFAIGLLLITRDRGFLRARDGARRWTPMIVGIICLADWFVARQQVELQIAQWVRPGGTGALSPGFYLAGLGALTATVVGSFAGLRQGEGRSGGPALLLRRPRRSDIPTLATTIGALAGLGLGAAVAFNIFPAAVVNAPLVFIAGFGVIAGARLGRAVGRWLS